MNESGRERSTNGSVGATSMHLKCSRQEITQHCSQINWDAMEARERIRAMAAMGTEYRAVLRALYDGDGIRAGRVDAGSLAGVCGLSVAVVTEVLDTIGCTNRVVRVARQVRVRRRRMRCI